MYVYIFFFSYDRVYKRFLGAPLGGERKWGCYALVLEEKYWGFYWVEDRLYRCIGSGIRNYLQYYCREYSFVVWGLYGVLYIRDR